MSRWLVCVMLCVVSLSLFCSKAPKLDQKVMDMVASVNSHDVTKELAFYTDDATFIIPGEDTIVGKAELRSLFEWDSTLACALEVADLVVKGDTVFVNSIIERNEFLRLAGIPEVRYESGTKMIFRDGLIWKNELSPLMPEYVKAFDDSLAKFAMWLGTAHPDRAAEMQSGSLDLRNSETARICMELIAEWEKSKLPQGQ